MREQLRQGGYTNNINLLKCRTRENIILYVQYSRGSPFSKKRKDYARITQGKRKENARITQGLRKEYARNTQGIRNGSAQNTQGLRKDYARITQGKRKDYARITQGIRKGYAICVFSCKINPLLSYLLQLSSNTNNISFSRSLILAVPLLHI